MTSDRKGAGSARSQEGRRRTLGNKCDWLLLVASLAQLARAGAGQNASEQQQQQVGPHQQAFPGAQLLPVGAGAAPASGQVPAHWQPSFALISAQKRAMNFSHLLVDERSQSIYVGATNWLLQVSLGTLRADHALRTGPAAGPESHWRDCAPADCQWPAQLLEPVQLLPALHAHNDLAGAWPGWPARSPSAHGNQSATLTAHRAGQSPQQQQQQQQQQPQQVNNYNKILAIDQESRQLIACNSLSQGACRKHQLGQIGNFSELIPLPVAANDEQSSSLALVVGGQHVANNKRASVLYVAATNSRQGPYREMVPAISGRYLEPASQRPMQIIERSFTDSARIDISFELRDYYLVNYVHSFQHQDYVYFVTVQRKSPLRQLEEWGYITRLARLCLNDLSFQSYAEITLECSQQATNLNYNLIQDAQLFTASPHLANQLGLRNQQAGQVLAGAFALSKDHTTKTQTKSAICLYPMERIEQKFNENIQQCYNGSARARNMNYIAGSVNDCPKPSKSASVTASNFCSEPLKLNGSLALQAEPVYLSPSQLITAVSALQAPSGPTSTIEPTGARPAQLARATAAAQAQVGRAHQVLLAGTGDGQLKRLVLLGAERAHEFDSIQLAPPATAEEPAEPVLADMQIAAGPGQTQFVVAATSSRLVKLRANGCKFAAPRQRPATGNWSETDCLQCAQLQDPFCGWCASAATCNTRDECLQSGLSSGLGAHWTPFDQIRCADYQPVAPQTVALQTPGQPSADVNVRIQAGPHQASGALATQLARAQFTCHFDYLALAGPGWGARQLGARPASSTTKATQARLNLHTWTLVIGCPLPPPNQRPASLSGAQSGELRVKLTVRPLTSNGELVQQQLRLSNSSSPDEHIERELLFYDCLARSGSCRTCLQAPQARPSGRRPSYSCAWCPLGGRCTFNASDADFGCAASALVSTTPQSASPAAGSQQLRAAHLAGSLDEAQTSVFGASVDRLAQCPAAEQAEGAAQTGSGSAPASQEILVPHQTRRSVQVSLRQPLNYLAGGAMRSSRASRLECLLEIEGSRARLGARLADAASSQQLVVCQESLFAYQEEVASVRGQLSLLVVGASNGETQTIETLEVIIYKCHLFGVNPPALTSTLGQTTGNSSAAWRAHELLASSAGRLQRRQLNQEADCSLCLNVERKYQCAWCNNRCQHADQCARELQASTCPPPRIDSIHPTSGPLEGGTLITIEGSNLGSSEREIQDKVSVVGQLCQLVMYSVSTRIVCKTAPSPYGLPLAAAVFVGNRAGVTSAQEKFHYKSVHLTDVNPRVGPVSGGTRLYLTGSNLNVGSRTQILLDDIPCALDSSEMSSQQISCVTAPNLLASSMRISRLSLTIDNSTHYLPYPFTYQPDPIITSIEPTESFVSGGRLILILGHHLASPQSNKLMVYHEHKHNIINATSCITQNDTLITCLTPAISRDLLASLLQPQNSADNLVGRPEQPEAATYAPGAGQTAIAGHHPRPNPLSLESGGLKLKISLFMDDVRSVRNLDEYYHHLPHYLTYYEDPQLFRMAKQVIDYADELVIAGENLAMKQLDQDMLISIGSYMCQIKAISAHQVVCVPPAKIAPVFDETGRLVDRPILPILGLIGSNLKFQIGHMQYSSRQYQLLPTSGGDQLVPTSALANNKPQPQSDLTTDIAETATSASLAILVGLALIGFVSGLAAILSFGLSKFRASKSEREYKRIQLQMGSIDAATGQPIIYQTPGNNLFENIHINNQSARSRALDYVNGALTGKKLFFQLNQSSFPPSPQTDISSLTINSQQANQQQHLVKLSSNGTILNSTFNQPFHHHQSNIISTSNASSSQSSPVSSTRDSSNPTSQQQNLLHHLAAVSPTTTGLIHHQRSAQTGADQQDSQQRCPKNGSSRNFNWTQEAPSTIVPYAVIEACNLTLEGKNAIKDYV